MKPLMHPKATLALKRLKRSGVYIVHGPKGVGLTTIIQSRLGSNSYWLVPDEPSIKVAEIKQLVRRLQVRYSEPVRFVIDEADTMTVAAQNAFLKTLEELPDRVTIILIAHDLNRLLPTVRSRAHTIYLALPSREQQLAYIKQHYPDVNSEVVTGLGLGRPAQVMALTKKQASQPKAGDRLSLLEQLCYGSLYERLAAAGKLQSHLPEIVPQLVSYARLELRRQPSAQAAVLVKAATECLAYQQAHMNNKLLLDSVVLAGYHRG